MFQDINSLNKQIAQLQDLVKSRGAPGGRHIQTHSNTIVVSLQVCDKVYFLTHCICVYNSLIHGKYCFWTLNIA